MQGVGLECLAGIPRGDAGNGASASGVDQDHQSEQGDGEKTRAHERLMKEQPLQGFPDDVKRGEEKQRCFDEGGEAFELLVAVGVVGVGGLVGNAHGKNT